MNTIEFTHTAYTVKSPGDGKSIRYEGEDWNMDIRDAKRIFAKVSEDYPTLTSRIVPDHFVQEFCRSMDSASWSGGRGGSTEEVFRILLRLTEKELKGDTI